MESSRYRLPVHLSAPPKKLVDEMLSEARLNPGRLVELPIDPQGSSEHFCLTVELEPTADRPVWTLYQGQGAESNIAWTYMLSDTDMISEVLSLSVAASYDKAGPAGRTEKAADARTIREESSAVDESVARPNVLLGHILVESGLVTGPMLDAALNLQEMVRQQNLNAIQATEVLRKVHERGQSVEDAIAEMRREAKSEEPKDAVDLLKSAGLVSDEDIGKAKQVVDHLRRAGLDTPKGEETAKEILDLLKLAGFINDGNLQAAMKAGSSQALDVCKSLLSSKTVEPLCFEVASRFVRHIRRGKFKSEQAIIALHYSQRSRTGFEETVHSLGWDVPVEN